VWATEGFNAFWKLRTELGAVGTQERETLSNLKRDLDAGRMSQEQYEAAVIAAGKASDDAIAATMGLGDSMVSMTAKTLTAADAQKLLTAAVKEANTAELASLTSGDAVAVAREALAEAVKLFGENSVQARTAQLKLNEAIESAAKNAGLYAAKLKEIKDLQAQLSPKPIDALATAWKLAWDNQIGYLNAGSLTPGTTTTKPRFYPTPSGKNPDSLAGVPGISKTSGLDPTFASMLKAAIAAALKAGATVTVASGRRTYAEQAALYAKYLRGEIGIAAKPGTSRHETGTGADVYVKGITPAQWTSILASVGLANPIKGDSGHVQAASSTASLTKGISDAAAAAKKAAAAAKELALEIAKTLIKLKGIQKDFTKDVETLRANTKEAYAQNDKDYLAGETALAQKLHEDIDDAWERFNENVKSAANALRDAFGGIFGVVSDQIAETVAALNAAAGDAAKGVSEAEKALTALRRGTQDEGAVAAAQNEQNAALRNLVELRESGASEEAIAAARTRATMAQEALTAATSARVVDTQAIAAAEERVTAAKEAQGVADKAATDKAFETSGPGRLAALKKQAQTFKDWVKNLNTLSTMGLSKDVIEALKKQGPASYEAVAALLDLSVSEVTEYNSTWASLGTDTTAFVTPGLRAELDIELEGLKDDAAIALDALKEVWKTRNAEIRDDALKRLGEIKTAAIETIWELGKLLPAAERLAAISGVRKTPVGVSAGSTPTGSPTNYITIIASDRSDTEIEAIFKRVVAGNVGM
jgi:hypothetical protein